MIVIGEKMEKEWGRQAKGRWIHEEANYLTNNERRNCADGEEQLNSGHMKVN